MQRVLVDLSAGPGEQVSIVEIVSQEAAAIEAEWEANRLAAIVYAGHQRKESRVSTTGTTPAELFRATLAPLTAYSGLVHLVGVDSGNGAVRVIRATVVAKRLNNGAILVGQPVVLASHADTGAATWQITPSVSGNDFVVTVTGAAGRIVDWFFRIDVDSFTPGGQP